MTQIVTKDIFALVTNAIIAQLEKGVIPWEQPWTDTGPPRNLITQRPYRGVNFLLLNNLPYPEKEYLTFKQITELGGRVKKGEKAHMVILWIWTDEVNTLSLQEVKGRKRPFLRYYFVFNVAQCTGISNRNAPLPLKSLEPIECCEQIIANMPNKPKIVHNESEAYYHLLADFINMPKRESFETMEGYYDTLFHELIHSTGHPDRLNRKELVEQKGFGTDLYSIEELTAQIGASFLSSHAGIAQASFTNSVAYIQGWLNQLKSDKRFIVYASAQAQKAADYVLNVKHPDNEIIHEATLNDGI